jgi:hypothetical protein
MTIILQDEIPTKANIFIDDLPIKGPVTQYSDSEGKPEVLQENPGIRRFIWEHAQDVHRIMHKIKCAGATFAANKAQICSPEVLIVGQTCNSKGRSPDNTKVDKILTWPKLSTPKEVRQFLTSGYIFTMAGGAVTWSSKRQATVALSMVEAEYVAMSHCAQQMVWMQTWLDEVEIEHVKPGVIKGDSRGAIALAKTTKDHGKVKHIDIRHHYLRELVKSEAVVFEQIPSHDNIADLFTKPLSRDHHHRFLASLNVH